MLATRVACSYTHEPKLIYPRTIVNEPCCLVARLERVGPTPRMPLWAWQVDGGGSINFRELNHALRQGAAVKQLAIGGANRSPSPGREGSPTHAFIPPEEQSARRAAIRKEWAERGRKKAASPRMRARQWYGDVYGV